MRDMSRQNLKEAFAGESQAHMKYKIFAEQAEKEGFKNLARMFKAVSYAEEVHARNHLKALGEVGDSMDNLQEAKEGEDYEVKEMYPAFRAVAKQQNEDEAVKYIEYALEAEEIHSEMYEEAKKLIAQGNDISDKEFLICPVCGYTAKEQSPDRCPVCNTKGEKFKGF